MSAGTTSVLSLPRTTHEARGHFNGAGFAGIRGVGNNFEVVFAREFKGKWITGHQRAGGRAQPRGNCGHNVMQHDLSQLRARGLIEYGGQSLLGPRQILDRNENHGWSAAVRAAAFSETASPRDGSPESSPLIVYESTVRASAARSSTDRMMVCVHCTPKLFARNASAARASPVSHTRRSRNSS